MKVLLIVACSKNGTIGKDNKLLWHLPEDLKFFKKTTINSYVIMGRKTYESIGKPLSQRKNIIISKKMFDDDNNDLIVFPDLKSACNYTCFIEQKNVFIIGGESIYNQAFEKDLVDDIYITIINKDYEGDKFFKFPKEKFKLESETKEMFSKENNFYYTRQYWVRK